MGSETEVEDTAQNDVVQDTDQSDPDTEETKNITELIFAGDVCLSGYVTANYDKAGISGVLEDLSLIHILYNTYNMGLVMIVAVSPENVDAAMEAIKKAGDTPYVVGKIENGEKGVTLC